MSDGGVGLGGRPGSGVLLRALLAASVGLFLGVASALAVQRPAAVPDAVEAPEPTAAAAGAAAARAAPAPQPEGQLLVVWSSGGLPPGLAEGIARLPRVRRSTLVRGDLVELSGVLDADGRVVQDMGEGLVVPIDAIAVEPETYAPFVPPSERSRVTALRPGDGLLGATAAALRGVGAGAELLLADGTGVRIAAVVDDEAIAGAELALPAAPEKPDAIARTPRYVLIEAAGERAAVEEAVRALVPGTPLRLRGLGETPFLRHGDAVLTLAAVKERFGEFAYRRTRGQAIRQDPAWVAEHITTVEVPILGRVSCHRAVVPALRGALAELAERNLGYLVDPSGFGGCHSSRLTAPLDAVSRHAWGIAIDINTPKNPVGQASTQDARLVEVFERWGFGWGGEWLTPDPAHFEYVRAPQAG